MSWTDDVCEALQKLTSVKADLEWNKVYQDLYDKAKKIIKKDTCMKFYDASGPLYLETDASGVSLRARLLQVREGMNCGHDEVPDNASVCQITFASKAYRVSSGTAPILNGKPLEHYIA